MDDGAAYGSYSAADGCHEAACTEDSQLVPDNHNELNPQGRTA